jgi:protein-disulfide isomerase
MTTSYTPRYGRTLLAACASLMLASLTTPALAADKAADKAGHDHAAETANVEPIAVIVEYGKADAPVVIEEFASLSCSHCADFAKNVQPELKKRYLDTGKVLLKTQSYVRNQPDLIGSMLLHCLADNEERQQFTKVLLEMQEQWAYAENVKGALEDIAKVGGLSAEKFQACVSDSKVETGLLKNLQVLSETRDIRGTPSFFINGKAHVGPFDITTLGKAIDAALGEAGGAKPAKKDAGAK